MAFIRALLAFLPRIWVAIRGLRVFGPVVTRWLQKIGTSLAGIDLLGYVMQKLSVWVIMWLARGALFKVINLAIIIFTYRWCMDLLDGLIFNDLGKQLLTQWDLLPKNVRCFLILVGLPSHIKTILSTAAAIGSVKLMIRLVTK